MTAIVRTTLAAARRSPSGRVGLAAVIILMGAAIVGMHSLGAGHQGGVMSPPAVAAAADNHASFVGYPTANIATSPSSEISMPAACAPGCLTGPHAGHAMSEVCLAILPTVLLLLLPRLRRPFPVLVRGLAGAFHARSSGLSRRPPPPLRPSLSKLCILRT